MMDTSSSEPAFQTLFEAAPGLYLVFLPDAPRYTIVAMSDAYARATMTKREDILGRGLFDVFPDNPADATATGVTELRASLERMLTTRVPDVMTVQRYDTRRPAESGSVFEERWWHVTNCPVFGPHGEIAYIMHAVEDVTEAHRVEEERQLFAALVENSSDFIGIADPSGKPIYVNPAGRRMVGLAADHPVSNTQIPEYYPPEDRALATDVILKGMVEHGRWSGETHFRHWKTGELIPVSDEHFLIRHPATGRILGMGTITRDISEARRTAAERERLLALANEFFDQASDSIFIADLDGRFTQVNATACKMLGYVREELIGKKIVDIIPPEDVARLAATREYLRSPGTIQVAEWTQVKKDGTPIPVEVSSKILPDGRWQALVRDISDRKRIERTLQESEERFRLTIDEAPIGMALVALDGRFVRVNRALSEIIGYSAAELQGLTFQAITHPDDLDADLALFGQLAHGDIPRYQLGKRYIRKDGTIVDVLLSASILRSRDGAPLYYIAQIEDITARKRAEKALERSERDFRELAESMPQIVWVTRADGWNIYFNQQWMDYTGLTLEESSGEGWITPFHPDDRQRAWDAWQRATQYHDTYSLECRLRRADGVYRWWLVRGVPLLGPNGEIRKWFGTCTDIEQIKAAEQLVKESETKFSGIVSISADAVISIDRDQRITIFNEGAEKIFGYSRSQAIGAPLSMLIPDRFRAAHRQHVERFASGEVTGRRMGNRLSTIAGLRKNGEEFPAEAAISKLQVGEKTLLTVALRDITERKRIEDELKDANASLDAIIENIPLTLFLKESQSLRFMRFNRAGEELLGWPRQRMIGKSDYDLWPQPQAEFFVQKDRETLNSGRIVDVPEEPIQTRHQGVRLLHTRKVPIFDAEGRPKYLLGISEDITERKRIEREQQFLAEASVILSASLDYEQTLVAVAQLVVRDFADWCVVDIMEEHEHSRRVKVISADPTKTALCTHLEQLRIDPNRPYLVRAVSETKQPLLMAHISADHLESVAQGPEHLEALRAVSPRSLMAVPLLIRGQLLGTLVFVSSTPSRVYGPRDLGLAEALADRAAVAIENARLYRASVHATQLRDQVLGVVAHDLRNPLSTILLRATALRRSGAKPERRSQKTGEAIHQAAARMNRLIQDLLDVALMESGQLTIERASLSVRALIAEAVEMQRPLASASSLELRIDVDRDVPDVWGDRDRLLQVFENLIGNAIKFTDAGGRITVSAASSDREIVFSVADTGRGIASEDLLHVFDRFWQATKAGRQGAGLGLPITKGIVEAHGGRIWVESTPGRGTTFSLTIPKASAQQDESSDASGSPENDGAYESHIQHRVH
jgi:PAS domain S-box-containing protein